MSDETSIDSEDEGGCTCPPPSYPLSLHDIVGIGFHIVGGMLFSIQSGIHAIGVEFQAAANHKRDRQATLEANNYYESEFNGIIAQPVLLDEPEPGDE